MESNCVGKINKNSMLYQVLNYEVENPLTKMSDMLMLYIMGLLGKFDYPFKHHSSKSEVAMVKTTASPPKLLRSVRMVTKQDESWVRRNSA
jgi:hypothetical protein